MNSIPLLMLWIVCKYVNPGFNIICNTIPVNGFVFLQNKTYLFSASLANVSQTI